MWHRAAIDALSSTRVPIGETVRLLQSKNRCEVVGVVKGFLRTPAPHRVFVVLARLPELLYPDDNIVELTNYIAPKVIGWTPDAFRAQELGAFRARAEPTLLDGNGAALEAGGLRRGRAGREFGSFFANEVIVGAQMFFPTLKLSQVSE
jgi:hypothetical protein